MRLGAAEAPADARPSCKVVHGPIQRASATLARAALLEVDDHEQDVPVVLAFGPPAGFTHVASLLSIAEGVGEEGTLQVERFDISGTDVLLIATERTTSWQDAPPGPEHHATRRWWFVCGAAEDGAGRCARVLLAASEPSPAWAPWSHGRFELALTVKGAEFELRRVSGPVPTPYEPLLGKHAIRELTTAVLP